MHLKKKINLFRYCGLTAFLLVITLLAYPYEKGQVVGIFLCVIGVFFVNLLLVYSVTEITATEEKRKKRGLWLFIGKLPFLAGVIFGSVHFMEGLVLIPLGLYLGQLLFLALSLRFN